MTNKTIPSEIDFSQKVQIPPDVMMQEIDGEAIILNLKSEMYFGLDDVGTHMWAELIDSSSIQAAFESLAKQYDVKKEQLNSDLRELLHKLLEQGLLVLMDGKTVQVTKTQPSGWRYIILALLLPPTIRLAINRWGYKAIHAWLRNNTPLPADHLNLLAKPEIINIASLMNAAANRSPIHTNCLQRFLTLWWLLRRVGVSSDMRIGVIKQEGVVKAHAWLEKDGVIINDNKANLREFTPFDQTIEPTLSDTL